MKLEFVPEFKFSSLSSKFCLSFFKMFNEITEHVIEERTLYALCSYAYARFASQLNFILTFRLLFLSIFLNTESTFHRFSIISVDLLHDHLK